jgi:uncharacterized protein
VPATGWPASARRWCSAPPASGRFAPADHAYTRAIDSSAGAAAAVLVPGYAGSVEQPIIQRVARQLRNVGIDPYPVSLSGSGRRPSTDLQREVDLLRAACDVASSAGSRRLALVGRSFGGRVCARLAAAEPERVLALVLLGHPIAPPGRPRPADELALETVRCPTLVVQGDADRLGPLAVLERIASANPHVELRVLPGVGHTFGRQEPAAATLAVTWLEEMLGTEASAPAQT